mmetsp:Transcript_48129/g.127434  ORF Transcript_48129/g.127434 Transcript_48129/m.127434 type:complete len:200 (+) Transcript_48129:436-1035(+)
MDHGNTAGVLWSAGRRRWPTPDTSSLHLVLELQSRWCKPASSERDGPLGCRHFSIQAPDLRRCVRYFTSNGVRTGIRSLIGEGQLKERTDRRRLAGTIKETGVEETAVHILHCPTLEAQDENAGVFEWRQALHHLCCHLHRAALWHLKISDIVQLLCTSEVHQTAPKGRDGSRLARLRNAPPHRHDPKGQTQRAHGPCA